MDGRYPYHCHYCTKLDNASGPRSTHQTRSCNYIAAQIWYENEIDSKIKLKKHCANKITILVLAAIHLIVIPNVYATADTDDDYDDDNDNAAAIISP